jgi:hypothetical protein
MLSLLLGALGFNGSVELIDVTGHAYFCGDLSQRCKALCVGTGGAMLILVKSGRLWLSDNGTGAALTDSARFGPNGVSSAENGRMRFGGQWSQLIPQGRA